ncbi:unnamed protein product, partial [Linum tenue]
MSQAGERVPPGVPQVVALMSLLLNCWPVCVIVSTKQLSTRPDGSTCTS